MGKPRYLNYRLMAERPIIALTKTVPSQKGNRFSEFWRHPAVLLILGFFLTGVVGSWLTNLHDEKQRIRDANSKSMDNLRASMDDLAGAYSQYFSHTVELIRAIETAAPKVETAAARIQYQQAYDHWKERYDVNMPNVLQRYPGKAAAQALSLVSAGMDMGMRYMNQCILGGIVHPLSADVGLRRYRLDCDNSAQSAVTATVRLNLYTDCVQKLLSEMRPNGTRDEAARSDDGKNWHIVAQACDVAWLHGTADHF
jgi:uncharacterized membrane-anchored protein YhcB (DUF1043 family)